MGLFDWATTPKAVIQYIDNHGIKHRLTAVQYGEKCVSWASGMGKLKSQHLAAFGKIRSKPDLIAKVSQVPSIAAAHGTAFFAAVYCTYPVIRLGISNELFKDIVQGAMSTISNGSHLSNGQPSPQEYLSQLASELGQYSAILLETAGEATVPSQDRMLFGIGGACQRLLDMLEREYAEIAAPHPNEDSVDDSEDLTTSSSEHLSNDVYIESIGSDEIVEWLKLGARPRLITALAKRLGVDENGIPADIQRLGQIADQKFEMLKSVLSNDGPSVIEERIKNALSFSLEAIGRDDNLTARLKAKLSAIPCTPTKPYSSPKIVTHSPFVEATRNKDSKTLLLAAFANAATDFVKGSDNGKSIVLLA